MFLVIFLFAIVTSAQVIGTGETSGKGVKSLLIAPGVIPVKDAGVYSYTFAVYTQGLTERLDVFAGPTLTTYQGKQQYGITGGFAYQLFKSEVVNVATLNYLSAPFTHRTEACRFSWYPSVVASRKLAKGITPYGGYAANIPFGNNKPNKIFSGDTVTHFVPMGVMVPVGNVAVYSEFDYHKTQKVFSVGIAYTFTH